MRQKKEGFGAQTSDKRSSGLIEIVRSVEGLIEIVRRLRQRVEAKEQPRRVLVARLG